MEHLSVNILDDDPDDQEFIRKSLRRLKTAIRVTSFYQGRDLLNQLKNEKEGLNFPDLIILNLNMSCLDGIIALKQIKRDAILSSIPVYVLTRVTEEFQIESVINCGARAIYSKPSNPMDYDKILLKFLEDSLMFSQHENILIP